LRAKQKMHFLNINLSYVTKLTFSINFHFRIGIITSFKAHLSYFLKCFVSRILGQKIFEGFPNSQETVFGE